MVIKDDKGKVVILMSKKDILDYIFEKCGFEVGLEAEGIFNKADESFTQEECEGCDVLMERDEEIEQLKSRLKTQKNLYIDFLKSKHLYSAAKMLQEFDNEEEEN